MRAPVLPGWPTCGRVACTLAPSLVHLALRCRMRMPLPVTQARCGGEGAPSCRAIVDDRGDHALACPRTGLLAFRGFVLERPGRPGGGWTRRTGQRHGSRSRRRRRPPPRLRFFMGLPREARPIAAMPPHPTRSQPRSWRA